MFQDTGGVSAQHQPVVQTNPHNEVALTEFNGDFQSLLPLGNITALNMTGLEITSLSSFPHLPHLEKLVLSKNKLSLGLEALGAAKLNGLLYLDLSHNPIVKLSAVLALRTLPALAHLDLKNCPVRSTPELKAIMFAKLPALELLDYIEEADESTEEIEGEEGMEQDFDLDLIPPPGQAYKLFEKLVPSDPLIRVQFTMQAYPTYVRTDSMEALYYNTKNASKRRQNSADLSDPSAHKKRRVFVGPQQPDQIGRKLSFNNGVQGDTDDWRNNGLDDTYGPHQAEKRLTRDLFGGETMDLDEEEDEDYNSQESYNLDSEDSG